MTTSVERFVGDCGGIASVRELAGFLAISEREVREWAHENDVPRAGNVFAFRVEDAQALVADLEANDDEEDEDEDEPEGNDDEEDDDDEEDGEDEEDENE